MLEKQSTEQEEWKPIHNYEDLYEISNFGRVCRVGKGRGAKVGRMLVFGKRRGYEHVSLWRKQISESRKVHQLVAETFLGPKPTERHEVNHKNGIRDDNRAENLEWCTRSENLWHAFHILGTMKRPDPPKGEKAPTAKLTQAQVDTIRHIYATTRITYQKLADEYGVCMSTIGYLMRGDTFIKAIEHA